MECDNDDEMTITHRVQKVLLNNVIYNRRNYVTNNVSHKKLTKQKL
jgi:hypothetical protein